jgi:hypothetical protein
MDTISRIAKILNISEVQAIGVTEMYDLPWATIGEHELVSRLLIAIKNAK